MNLHPWIGSDELVRSSISSWFYLWKRLRQSMSKFVWTCLWQRKPREMEFAWSCTCNQEGPIRAKPKHLSTTMYKWKQSVWGAEVRLNWKMSILLIRKSMYHEVSCVSWAWIWTQVISVAYTWLINYPLSHIQIELSIVVLHWGSILQNARTVQLLYVNRNHPSTTAGGIRLRVPYKVVC